MTVLETGTDPDLTARIRIAVGAVRARIADAARAAGRAPDEIHLVAVAKLHPVQAVRGALAAGVHDIGENYAQELAAKSAAEPAARWHFIGRLQRNKAGVVVQAGALVHSLDSLSTARSLAHRAVAAGTVVEALVQVEVDDRPAAHGVRPGALPAFVDECRALPGLRLRGLMVMPAHADEVHSHRVFAAAARLRDRVVPDLPELSMGMSHDLEQAVAEGSTLVRVGTAIFGPRPAAQPDTAGRS